MGRRLSAPGLLISKLGGVGCLLLSKGRLMRRLRLLLSHRVCLLGWGLGLGLGLGLGMRATSTEACIISTRSFSRSLSSSAAFPC